MKKIIGGYQSHHSFYGLDEGTIKRIIRNQSNDIKDAGEIKKAAINFQQCRKI